VAEVAVAKHLADVVHSVLEAEVVRAYLDKVQMVLAVQNT
jgi:hypothetical protein